MLFSDLFHQEGDRVERDNAPDHIIFSCLQWKTPSLEVLPQAAKQSVAVMYGDSANPLNPYVRAVLERAYVLGAMSSVKLIAVHQNHLRLFLDDEVSSATFQEIESLWTKVMSMGQILIDVDFANVSEVCSGRSDYVFWQVAKEILENHALGIEQYDLKALDEFSDDEFIDEELCFGGAHEDVRQPQIIQACSTKMPYFAEWISWFSYTKCLTSPRYICPQYRKSDL